MPLTEKYLGQLRPADTNAASLYSPASPAKRAIVRTIIVANNTGSAATFRIFHDNDGTTYDQSTALYYGKSVAANDTHKIETYIVMDDTSGNLAVRTGTANALTFTAYGAEIS